MLISKETGRKNNKTIYICDRCKKECINTRERRETVGIGAFKLINGDLKWKKEFDLCIRCYKSMIRGIQKYANKMEN